MPKKFQSTHPLRGATISGTDANLGDKFQSTHPLRGATRTPCRHQHKGRFQSTHPLRGATAANYTNSDYSKFQSTHPLRGATRGPTSRRRTTPNFNPRTPCGVRPLVKAYRNREKEFQSTHPLRGATGRGSARPALLDISIHAPLAGCDSSSRCSPPASPNFNPRTPCGVRPLELKALKQREAISIHAPLAGCDSGRRAPGAGAEHFNPRTPCGVRPLGFAAPGQPIYFNPRTPCGVRLLRVVAWMYLFKFQSTHPLRGATEAAKEPPEGSKFQSTHPLRGATLQMMRHYSELDKFQSTHPLRGATLTLEGEAVLVIISIHAPLAGCD